MMILAFCFPCTVQSLSVSSLTFGQQLTYAYQPKNGGISFLSFFFFLSKRKLFLIKIMNQTGKNLTLQIQRGVISLLPFCWRLPRDSYPDPPFQLHFTVDQTTLKSVILGGERGFGIDMREQRRQRGERDEKQKT